MSDSSDACLPASASDTVVAASASDTVVAAAGKTDCASSSSDSNEFTEAPECDIRYEREMAQELQKQIAMARERLLRLQNSPYEREMAQELQKEKAILEARIAQERRIQKSLANYGMDMYPRRLKRSSASIWGPLPDLATPIKAIKQAHGSMALDIRQLKQDIHSLLAGLWTPDQIADLPQRMLGNLKALKEEHANIDKLINDVAKACHCEDPAPPVIDPVHPSCDDHSDNSLV